MFKKRYTRYYKKPLINHQIRAKKVRLIDAAGKQIGVIALEEAIKKAKENGLDLIQVTEKVCPPVCKILDYGKYLYKEEKKKKSSRKGGEIKGIRLRFNIAEHDVETRIRQTEKFLKQGNKVKIEMNLRGRERALQNFAKDKIAQFLKKLEEKIPYKIERELKKEPRGLTIIISKNQHGKIKE